ncbi:MAG TPA: cell envelope integrity protein TolA [Gallionella sp.]
MSATVYHEPNRIPAGVLTLLVHGAFFALLFLGFTWQTQPPAAMQVELWESLPAPVTEPTVQPPAPKVEEPAQSAPAPKAEKVKAPDIALPDRKKEKLRTAEKKPEKKRPAAKPAETRPADAPRKPEAAAAAQPGASEQAAASDRVVGEYQDKIRAKIRRNIVMPPNVPSDAVAIFRVTLLPGGSVLPPRLVKSSGNALYDAAVERAILKSDPLPLPPDAALFNRFRELELKFRPGD